MKHPKLWRSFPSVISPAARFCVVLRRCAALSAAFLLAVILPVHADTFASSSDQQEQAPQNPLKQLSLDQLGNIEVVTKNKAPQPVWKTAAAIYVITQDDIKRSGVTTIPDALRLAPGVEVAQISSDKWSVGVRGFGSRLNRDVLVLIDGRSVYSTLIAGTYWEVQETLLEDIDRIEVIRGPGGTVWGPNAVNGVINIITKSSKDTQGILVKAGGGNVEQDFSAIRYGGQRPNGLTYRFYAKEFNRAPEYHFRDNNYDTWYGIQGGFRADWAKDSANSYTLQGDIYDQRAGERVSLINYAPPYSVNVDRFAQLSGGNILGRWTHTFGEGRDLQLQLYYDRTNRREPNFGDLRNTYDIDLLDRFYLGSRNHISWGTGARASHGFELAPTTGLYFAPNPRTDQLYTGFAEDDFSLSPNHLALEIGTKIIHTNYIGVELEPSGRLLWTPSDTQTVWIAATHAVRTPSDGERDFYLSGLVAPTTPLGIPEFARFNANPNFKSEKLDGYELGFRTLLTSNAYVDLAGFYNQYYDLFSEDITGPAYIETSPSPTHILIPAEFGNGLVGNTTGAEIAPEWKPVSFWRLGGSYSFLRMALKRGPNSRDIGTAPITVGESPKHQVVLNSAFDLPRSFSFDFFYRYVSALPSIDIADYSTANARLAWNVTPHLELSVVGENLLQPYHVEFASSPGPNVAIRRSVYGKFVWKTKD